MKTAATVPPLGKGHLDPQESLREKGCGRECHAAWWGGGGGGLGGAGLSVAA